MTLVVHHLVVTLPSAMWHLHSALDVCDCFCPWAVTWVYGRPLAFVGGQLHCTLLLVLGAMWWFMEERKSVTCCDMSVTFNSHMRSHEYTHVTITYLQ